MKEFLNNKGIGPEKFPGQFDIIAKYVSEWTKVAGTMLPKEPGEIKKMLNTIPTVTTWANSINGVVPVGFGAITNLFQDNWAELGYLLLDPSYETPGLGQYVVKSLIYLAKNSYPDKKFFTFCSEENLKFFVDNGAEIVDESIFPKEVTESKLIKSSNQKFVVIK